MQKLLLDATLKQFIPRLVFERLHSMASMMASDQWSIGTALEHRRKRLHKHEARVSASMPISHFSELRSVQQTLRPAGLLVVVMP